MLPERGGGQGDYRQGIRAKISNAIECLKTEPLSKRAVSWPAGLYLQSSCFTFSFSTARCRSSPSRSTRRAAKRWTGRCRARQSVSEVRFLPPVPVLTLYSYCCFVLLPACFVSIALPRAAPQATLPPLPHTSRPEIHLYLEDGLLKATGIMRMQVNAPPPHTRRCTAQFFFFFFSCTSLSLQQIATRAFMTRRMQNSNIFVKNIHWVAALLHEVRAFHRTSHTPTLLGKTPNNSPRRPVNVPCLLRLPQPSA
jgi:hypothetical protein